MTANELDSSLVKVWKPELYKIQLEAPTPKALICQSYIEATPAFYGYEYHGLMDHKTSEKLLKDASDGTYLIRRSPDATNFNTLSLRFDGRTKHFKIYHKENAGHFLRENFKRYDTVHELVADGLVSFYMKGHAAPIFREMMTQTGQNYQQSPYMTLNRRKLCALSKHLQKSLQMEDQGDQNATKKKEIKKPDEKVTGSASNAHDEQEVDVLPNIYQKSHKFKIHTFKGLNWCEFCANFLWGFTAQGVKCEDCGFTAHNKCSELVPAKCVPDMKKIRGVFGSDLTTIVTAHKCQIPFVVRQCVEEVEARGMLQEGIYRVSGFADEIEALKMTLDRNGEKSDMSETTFSNINVIAGTLKLYLRLLPVPLINYDAYPVFIESTRCQTVTDQIAKMREAMKRLPPAHYDCLKYMIEHLHRVSSHHAVNKMNEHNIATVFAPTLIATPPQLTDLSQEIFALTSLITHCQSVFKS